MNTQEMLAHYEVIGFSYGVCMVKRKADGVMGSLLFDSESGERQYHSWLEG